jgi:hypothetical protein
MKRRWRAGGLCQIKRKFIIAALLAMGMRNPPAPGFNRLITD